VNDYIQLRCVASAPLQTNNALNTCPWNRRFAATDFFFGGRFQKKDDKCPKTATASASKKKNSENDKREGGWEGAKRANLSRYPVAVIDSSAKATQTRQGNRHASLCCRNGKFTSQFVPLDAGSGAQFTGFEQLITKQASGLFRVHLSPKSFRLVTFLFLIFRKKLISVSS